MAGYVTLRGSDDPQDEGLLGGTSSHAGEDWKARLATMGKKMGESMNAVGGKLTESMTEIGDKMKNIFHTPTLAERLVEEATDEILISPDWGRNLLICDLVNSGKLPGGETVRAIKKQLGSRNSHVQMLALALLEMAVKNCSSLFSDVANERVLDDMVRVADEPHSAAQLREKVLKMIEAWGESTEELRASRCAEWSFRPATPSPSHPSSRRPPVCIPHLTYLNSLTVSLPLHHLYLSEPQNAWSGVSSSRRRVPRTHLHAARQCAALIQPLYFLSLPRSRFTFYISQSLKMRGVVFPPRDAESLAPIFTPPASVPPAAVQAAHALLESVEGQMANEVAPPGVSMVPRPEGGHMVVFDSKEIFEISRNSVELLGTVLSSAPPEQVLTDEVVPALAAQCRAAKSSLLRLIEHENSNSEAPSETLLKEGAGTGGAGGAGAAGESTQSGAGKKEEDDLIVF
ncbi:unnamed protein product [Closterium sp. NIES-65]|nr:unnamed protein product [Closterium sp. NIES-65]